MVEIHAKHYGRGSLLAVVVVLLIGLSVVATAFLVLERIEAATRENVRHSVETLLEVTHNALNNWRSMQLKLIQHELKDTKNLPALIAAQLEVYEAGSDLRQSLALRELRRQLRPLIDEFGYHGFFVIAPDLISVASMRDSNIGTLNLLAKEEGFLQRVFQGESLFSKVVISDVPLPDSKGRLADGQPTMFLASPVRDERGNVIAVLTFRIAPAQDFGQIARLGRIGATGETYFFDRDGWMISESRFADEAEGVGLLAPGQTSVLNIELRDPGGDMTKGFRPTRSRQESPFTHAVSEALAGRAGMDLDGYRDYRGKQVIGAWHPIDSIQGIGMVAEIDRAEAYGVFNLTRRLLLITVGLTVTLLLVLAATLAGGRKRALALAEGMTDKLRRSEQHFHHLATISQVISRATGVDSMTVAMVQEIQRIFTVDRVWLSPVGRSGGSLRHAPVEATSAVCTDGVFPLEGGGSAVKLTELMRESLAEAGPVLRDARHETKDATCEHALGSQAEMCIALYPQIGEPWLLGLCSCAERRNWSAEEIELLRAIAERMTNAFTNLLLLDELEEALRERKSIMDTVPDVIVTLDPDGRVIDWNHSMELAAGLAPEELRRRSMRELIYEDDREVVEAAIERCLQEGYTATEARLAKKGVGPVTYYWVAASRRDAEGNVVSITGSGRDITESLQAQEAIRRSEARLAQAQRIARLGNWEWNIEQNSLYWSDQVYCIFGLAPDSFEATYEGFMERIHPDDRAAVEEAVRASLEQHGAFNIDHRISLPDGSVRIVNEQAEVVFSNLGSPVRMLGTVQDVTERKVAAEELRRHRDHLQEMVDEQTAGLKAAKEAAEQANQAKSEFLANMSHELRTPMHAILNFAAMGEEKASSAPPEKLQGYFGRIRISGGRLLVLLNDLLDLAKLEAGRMQFEMARHDLRKVVATAETELGPLLAKKSLHIEMVPTVMDTSAWFDADRLLQVMHNLLSNAIKFSPQGGRIQIAFREAALQSGRRRSDEGAVAGIEVSVADEGIGVPPGEMDAIFDKFVQSSKTKTGAGGTGLGLAICKEIIEGHGGKIWAENVPGDGARFVFKIPRRPRGMESPPSKVRRDRA